MLGRLLGIRAADRRAAWTGAGALAVVIAGHTMLETARDALFLSTRAAADLPWAYLAIAVLSFAIGLVGGRASPARTRATLQTALVLGAVVTAAFWPLTDRPTPAIVLGLYVWAGIFASVVVMLVWLFLGAHVDLGQAKRIYGFVAAGGLAGAALGGGIAALLQLEWPPQSLLLATSTSYLVAALLLQAGGSPVRSPGPEGAGDLAGVRAALGDPYLRRIVLIAVLPPIVFTGIDFVFKTTVSKSIPAAALGPFFARYNLVVYGGALLVHLVVATRLLRGLGVIRGLAILPLLLLLGSAAYALTGGLLAVLALKGVDVAFRHSLHRASSEILFLPVASELRGRVKALADGIGQRGGQALGSLLLLWAARAGVGTDLLGGALALASAVWVALVIELRRHYVARFRSELGAVHGEADVTIPDLDLHALEVLVTALGSSNDTEVIAALDMLERYDRGGLVSPFILYHPSGPVVIRALQVLSAPGREDVAHIVSRLLERDDPAVRAAALAALGTMHVDAAQAWRLVREDASPEVRATAFTMLLSRAGDAGGAEAERLLTEALGIWPAGGREALARAVGTLPVSLALRVADALLADGDPSVRRVLATALAEEPRQAFIGPYTALLAHRESREPARRALVELGAPALAHCRACLADPSTSEAVRLHLPRTISRFQSDAAAGALVEALAHTTDTRVRYKILRGLGRMRTNDPSLPVDREALLRAAAGGLSRAVTTLSYAVAYRRFVSAQGPARPRDPLAALLREKEGRAMERVFRILHVLEPGEQFRSMFEGLASSDPHVQASSRELLEHVVADGALRAGILAMSERLPAEQRLGRVVVWCDVLLPRRTTMALVGGDDEPGERGSAVAAVLAAMRGDSDPVVAGMAAAALDAAGATEVRAS
jgi:hypothetical protein